MSRKKKSIGQVRQYYRKDGFVFMVDTVQKYVTVPQSVDSDNYPDEVKEVIKKKKYNVQLTIE